MIIVQKKVQAKAHKTFKKYKAIEKKLKELVGKGKTKLAKKYAKKLESMKKTAVKMRKKADKIIRGGKKLQRLGKKQEVDKPINPDDFKAKVIQGQTFYQVKVQMKVELKPGKPFKLKVKPELQKDQPFGAVKMGGFAYSVQPHHKNPAKIPKKPTADFNKPPAEESDEVGEVDVVSEILGENSSLSLRDLKQTILKITMVKILPPETQKMLRDLNLDLRPSLGRCEAVNGHGNCKTLWGTLSVKKCPRGYQRFGCCQCVLPCPGADFVDNGNYCGKPKPYLTHMYHNLSDCRTHNKLEPGICMLFGTRGYTEKCDKGYSREGEFNCRKDCPYGWPDDGNFCTKIGNISKQIPYPWMPGDMALSPKYLKKKAELERTQMLKLQKAKADKRAKAEKALRDKHGIKVKGDKKKDGKKGKGKGKKCEKGKKCKKDEKGKKQTAEEKLKKFIRDL